MTKIFKISMFALVFASLAIYGCKKSGLLEDLASKDRSEISTSGFSQNFAATGVKDPLTLSEDKEFVKFITNSAGLITSRMKAMKAKSLNIPTVQKQLSELQSKNLSNDEQLVAIDEIFKQKMASLTDRQMKLISDWALIKSKYQSISPEILQKETAEVFKDQFAKTQGRASGFVESSEEGEGCSWAYWACAAAVVAGEIACMAACVGAGPLAPLCMNACGVAAVAALALCINDYCQ